MLEPVLISPRVWEIKLELNKNSTTLKLYMSHQRRSEMELEKAWPVAIPNCKTETMEDF